MRRLIRPVVLSFLLMALVYPGITETGTDYTQVAEDVDIMSRVIEKAIQKKFPDEYQTAPAFFSRASQGCQGIYLSGYGAVFMTSIGFPVAEKKVSQAEDRADDLWQEAKSEMSGVEGRRSGIRTSEDYNPEKVSQLREELLKIVGTYGPNIRQLGPQENIVIAVQGTPGPFPEVGFTYPHVNDLEPVRIGIEKAIEEYGQKVRSTGEKTGTAGSESKPAKAPEAPASAESIPGPADLAELNAAKSELDEGSAALRQLEAELAKNAVESAKSADALKQAESKLRERAEQLKSLEVARRAYIGLPMLEAAGRSRTTLIIRVSKESIMAYKEGKADLNALMKQAEIIQY